MTFVRRRHLCLLIFIYTKSSTPETIHRSKRATISSAIHPGPRDSASDSMEGSNTIATMGAPEFTTPGFHGEQCHLVVRSDLHLVTPNICYCDKSV
ncbi:hypothetical protein JTE90_003670 [Oedothorax gibbosus]|uniref:Secreted protein n=1 Tax=Oedothorax gibbosus TaxID=931172 RepID=A0AAV6VSM4_9ARAC|nr:hypothetical protein JTE90_003670 [Oedothorax gibbosus]